MAEFWQETINLLQPPGSSRQLISKPQLKPELLQKIPFKFLHDVIVSVGILMPAYDRHSIKELQHGAERSHMFQVLKKTKFAPGIFTNEELDRKWDGYDKEKVVCDFVKHGEAGSGLHQCYNRCAVPAGKGCSKPEQAKVLGRRTWCRQYRSERADCM